MSEESDKKTVQIEQYSFGLHAKFEWGVTSKLTMRWQPEITVRPDHLITNADEKGLFILESVRFANRVILLNVDAHMLRDRKSELNEVIRAFFEREDCTLTPANGVYVEVLYTGAFNAAKHEPRETGYFYFEVVGAARVVPQ